MPDETPETKTLPSKLPDNGAASLGEIVIAVNGVIDCLSALSQPAGHQITTEQLAALDRLAGFYREPGR